MQYELNIEQVSPITRKLHFIVAADEVRSELERAFTDLKRRVRLPGFRPGKVPRNMLEARFGSQIKGEVGGRLIEQSYREAVTDLAVTGQPSVEERGEVDGKTALTFTIQIDVRPEIDVSGHKGVAVDMPVAKVTAADVDRAVAQQLAAQARIEEVTDERAVEAGDLVVTELKLTKDGEEIANEAGTMLHTLAERYYPGVEGLLVGMSKDETKTEEVTIGEGTEYEHLHGVTCTAEVKVVSIQAHITPELDDEVAKAMGYDKGAKEMKKTLEEQLKKFAEDSGRNQARVSILEKLVEGNEFEVPQGMIDEQMSSLADELRARQAYMGRDPSKMTFSEAEMADLRKRAEFAARASTILSGVSRQEKLEVTEAEYDDKLTELAEARGQAVEAIRAYVEQEGASPMLRARILEEKTLEWLLDNAKVTQVEPPAPETPAAAAPGAAPEWNKSMKKAELLDVAKATGLDVNSKMTKGALVEALENA